MPVWADHIRRLAVFGARSFGALRGRRTARGPAAGGRLRRRFWERYGLHELNCAEWEALCDGCGLCCLLKFEEVEGEGVTYTNVACKLLDRSTCRCKHYECRAEIVPDCIALRPETVESVIDWMPPTCAYRLRHEGRPLFQWHYLISGSRETVHEAGVSVKDLCIPEYDINLDDLESYAVDWGKA